MNTSDEEGDTPPSVFSIRDYLRRIQRFKPLTDKQVTQLLIDKQNGDGKAFQKLVDCHLRSVLEIARYYCSDTVKLPELITIGNQSLCSAVRRYTTQGVLDFNSYLVGQIATSIDRALHPDDHHEVLDADIEDDYHDLYTTDNDAWVMTYLIIAIAQLDEVSAEVVMRLFGIGDRDKQTQRRVAEHFNISTYRVCRIRNKALGKLEKSIEAQKRLRQAASKDSNPS